MRLSLIRLSFRRLALPESGASRSDFSSSSSSSSSSSLQALRPRSVVGTQSSLRGASRADVNDGSEFVFKMLARRCIRRHPGGPEIAVFRTGSNDMREMGSTSRVKIRWVSTRTTRNVTKDPSSCKGNGFMWVREEERGQCVGATDARSVGKWQTVEEVLHQQHEYRAAFMENAMRSTAARCSSRPSAIRILATILLSRFRDGKTPDDAQNKGIADPHSIHPLEELPMPIPMPFSACTSTHLALLIRYTRRTGSDPHARVLSPA